MKHYRPKFGKSKAGYYRGYYCGRCGEPGLSMMGRCSKHTKSWEHSGVCLANPTRVAILAEANTPEAERKRKFVGNLKRGKQREPKEWEKFV